MMPAEQNRPASPEQAPDPSNNYERAHPENEAGMGRLDNNQAVPEDSPDRPEQAVKNKQDPSHQINADDAFVGREMPQADNAAPLAEQPDHSMHEEEPDGWDQAPTDIRDNRQKRHPRTEGRGGTP
jgi:hypothetical protein